MLPRIIRVILLATVFACTFFVSARAGADDLPFTRKEDVIYGRKLGTALTLDVFTPGKNANGAAVIWVVSGGFFSSHDSINAVIAKPFLHAGYTVFAVVHGSQPRFQVPEIVEDMERSVRFIRHHASDYGIDPNRIGVTGGSAGGHLSLMLGTTGKTGDAKAKDPVDRESSRVQAVACFFPPTDLLNYGMTGREFVAPTAFDPPFRAAFDYRELDKSTMLWERVTDMKKRREIARSISPIYFITPETVPTLIMHGDQDKLVPLQQSETFIEKLKGKNVDCKLIVKKGGAHGWPNLLSDMDVFVDWFDRHLKKSTGNASVGSSAVPAPAERP